MRDYISFVLNGRARDAARHSARHHPPQLSAQDRASDRHQGRLRGGRLRRLHRGGRRAAPAAACATAPSMPASCCCRCSRAAASPPSSICAATDGALHPVQQAMVDGHGSQCGFCTPGFVMSLYAAYLSEREDARGRRRINDMLAGNLCRCTGYGPIVRAAQAMYDLPAPGCRRSENRDAGAAPGHCPRRDGRAAKQRTAAASSRRPRWQSLARLYDEHPEADHRRRRHRCRPLGHQAASRHRHRSSPSAGCAELQTVLEDGGHAAHRRRRDLERSRGGDRPPLSRLRRAAAPLRLRAGAQRRHHRRQHRQRLADRRRSAGADRAGRQLDAAQGDERRGRCRWSLSSSPTASRTAQPGEFVEAIEVPLLEPPERLKCYKISKRFDQDISAVCGCFNIDVAGRRSREQRASATAAWRPRRSARQAVEAALIGKAWTLATVTAALPAFDRDYTPLTDMRGSAGYRSQAAREPAAQIFP